MLVKGATGVRLPLVPVKWYWRVWIWPVPNYKKTPQKTSVLKLLSMYYETDNTECTTCAVLWSKHYAEPQQGDVTVYVYVIHYVQYPCGKRVSLPKVHINVMAIYLRIQGCLNIVRYMPHRINDIIYICQGVHLFIFDHVKELIKETKIRMTESILC